MTVGWWFSSRAGLALAANWVVVGGAAGVFMLHEAAHDAFALHMIQHEVIVFVMAPAAVVLLAQLRWGRLPSKLNPLVRLASRPAVTLSVASGALWLWHLPTLYDGALHSNTLHVLEHGTLLAAYMLFWWPLLPRSSPLTIQSNAGRAIYLSIGAMQGAVLGALITFADSPWYAFYSAADDSALGDQQLAGAIMWFVGPIVFGVATAVSMGRRRNVTGT
jgi:cytochrome c oxidase assembly factor CtaG